MSSKQRKFSIISEFYTFFNQTGNDICLFAHVSNLNVVESNKIKIFCNANNVKSKYIKINLLKKLTKNSIFLNLLSGPTKLFFFKDTQTFLNFMKNVPLNTKIHPLAVFFDNQFFSYTYFYNLLNTIKVNGDLNSTLLLNQKELILNLSKTNINLVNSTNFVLTNLITSLPYYSNTKKN